MPDSSSPVYGLMAEFLHPEELVVAARRARERGFSKLDAYAPYPVEGLPEALAARRSPLPMVFLIAGLGGGAGGYFMQWYAMGISYPLNVGGRPLHSWPSFIPVTFELTILTAALVGVVTLFWLVRLPRLHRAVFAVPGFERATVDRFFLRIEGDDPRFSEGDARAFLLTLHPLRVMEISREDYE